MDDKPLAAVIADLTHETAGWGSIGARFALEQIVYAAVGPTPAGTITHGREDYMATRHGERKYAQYTEVEGRDVCVLFGYDVTTRCASVRYAKPPFETRQTSITISKAFLDEAVTGSNAIPAPLPYYVGLVPIHQAITTAERLGPSQVAGRDCFRFYFSKVGNPAATEDRVYHLDALTSFPLKVETFLDRAHFDAASPFSVWEAEAIGEAQGFHFAVDSRFTTFAPGAQGKLIPQLINKYHAASIQFNNAIPGSAFWPRADAGVFYDDTITGKSGYNTIDGKAPTATAAAPPAILPWPPWITTGGITLGLALLVVGLTRRFRRA